MMDERTYEDPPARASGRRNLPYWIAGGLGLAATTAGFIAGQVVVHESRQPDANTAEHKERALVYDYVAWGVGVLMTGTLLWYWIAPSGD